MTKFFCKNCRAYSEMGAEFGEWSGVVVCHSCKTIGDKSEFTATQLETLHQEMFNQSMYIGFLEKAIKKIKERVTMLETKQG